MRWLVWFGVLACSSQDDADTTGDTGSSGFTIDSGAPLTAGGWPEEWSDQEQEVFTLSNIERRVVQVCGGVRYGAAQQMVWSDELSQAARAHSEDMARRGFFDHVAPGGSQPTDRAAKAGYVRGLVGENIASGQATPRAVVDSWMDSPGHCVNIMNNDFVTLGVGLYVHRGTPFWTQVFGTVR